MSQSGVTSAHQRFEFDSLTLDPDAPVALFRQLESQLRESIWLGKLKPGERLPSTRLLAKQLSVARNTVINAYDQLVVEGFLVTEQGSGTRVALDFQKPYRKKIIIEDNSSSSLELELSSRYAQCVGADISLHDEGTAIRPFRAHTPDVNAFPSDIWGQLLSRRLRTFDSDLLAQLDSCGYQPLREAIASYLGADRSIATGAEQIVITAGAQQGVELLAKALINPGDYVVFEEPGYTHAMMSFEMSGAKVISIPVDEQGLDVKKLYDIKQRVKIVYTTPASHFPLSMSLSHSRRKALLDWAKTNNCLIIEDDYNGEYRYSGRPIATLFEQNKSNQVVYMSSFSKLLFPSLRLGFMVVPHALIQPLTNLRWLLDRHSPPLEQTVLTDFINEGYFASHLRKMRILYFKRQQAFLTATQKHLKGIINVPPLDSGLHLIGWLEKDVKEQTLLKAAAMVGIDMMPVSMFCRLPATKPSMILGYAAHTEQQLIQSTIAFKKSYLANLVTTHPI